MHGAAVSRKGRPVIYEYTGEQTVVEGVVLRRIRATITLIDRGITAGDVGGWIESDRNLVDRGWVGEDAAVYQHAVISDDAQVRHRGKVRGQARIRGRAAVYDDAVVDEDAIVEDDSSVGGDAQVGAGCVLVMDTHLRTGVFPVAATGRE